MSASGCFNGTTGTTDVDKQNRVAATTECNNNTCDIPSIDLKPYFENKGVVIGEQPTKDQLDVANTIHNACQQHGFVHVTNFGFTSEMGRRLFSASKDLFDNPTKLDDYQPWSPITNIGFSPYKNETLNTNRQPDLKEAFNLRFPPKWNLDMHKFDTLPTSFQSIVKNIHGNGDDDDDDDDDDESKSLFNVLKLIANRYAIACAVALGLPYDTFSKTLTTNNLCTLRFLHYPPCTMDNDDDNGDEDTGRRSGGGGGGGGSARPIRAGEHTDYVSTDG
jgi:isopenicillin N synthase-like dioxygenase